MMRVACAVLTLLLCAGIVWVNKPLRITGELVDLKVPAGASARAVADSVKNAGVDVSSDWLFYWFRVSGKSRQIQAGSYELTRGLSPYALLEKLAQGDVAMRRVTLVEGWNIRQVRQALRQAPDLLLQTTQLSDAQLMAALGLAGTHAEGQFFPDTYTYTKHSTDTELLTRAQKAMERQLADVWAQRNEINVLQSPKDALILASIIEKETGQGNDRDQISAVFHNRLRIGMPLQTDPTVIYGLGTRFDGNLRKVDLQTDTPYNTYTRNGLPPSPISMPGKAALLAAVNPVRSKDLYFVARGDGSSQFSETLDAHNDAVRKYILGK